MIQGEQLDALTLCLGRSRIVVLGEAGPKRPPEAFSK